jgi:hypothetical protein
MDAVFFLPALDTEFASNYIQGASVSLLNGDAICAKDQAGTRDGQSVRENRTHIHADKSSWQ